MLRVANIQRNDDNAAHVRFHGKGVEVEVILIVTSDLGNDDPLDKGMQEAACEENPFLDGRRRRHGCVWPSQVRMVPSTPGA